MSEQKFPAGWDERRVKSLITHYDNLSDEEQEAEDEAAQDENKETVISVPAELLPAIRQLIATHKSA